MRNTECGKFKVSDDAIYRVKNRVLKLYYGSAYTIESFTTILLYRSGCKGFAVADSSYVIALCDGATSVAIGDDSIAGSGLNVRAEVSLMGNESISMRDLDLSEIRFLCSL